MLTARANTGLLLSPNLIPEKDDGLLFFVARKKLEIRKGGYGHGPTSPRNHCSNLFHGYLFPFGTVVLPEDHQADRLFVPELFKVHVHQSHVPSLAESCNKGSDLPVIHTLLNLLISRTS